MVDKAVTMYYGKVFFIILNSYEWDIMMCNLVNLKPRFVLHIWEWNIVEYKKCKLLLWPLAGTWARLICYNVFSLKFNSTCTCNYKHLLK